MKISHLFTLFLFAILSACGRRESVSENSISLDNPARIYSQQEMDQFLEKSKFSKTQRINSIKNLQDAFKKKYIGYTLKEKLIGKHPDKIFSDCIDRESKSKDALFSFEFYDHVLICLAQFKDSHLDIGNTHSVVTTFIGSTSLIKNKVIITGLRSELIKEMDKLKSKNQLRIADKLSIGDEIISIDGKSPAVVMSELEKYISSSSDSFRRKVAASKLFYRDFNYPQKKMVNLKIKNKKSEVIDINLEWFIDGRKMTTLDSRMHLKKIGIVVSKELNIPDSLLQEYGRDASHSVFDNIDKIKIYIDSSKKEVLRFGVTSGEKKVCYIQLLNFNINMGDPDNLYPISDKRDSTGKLVSYIQVLKNFLSSCEMDKNDLLLDLRSNPGGDVNLSERIFSMLEVKSQSNIYYGYVWNVSSGGQNLILDLISDIQDDEIMPTNDAIFRATLSAQNKNQSVSDGVFIKKITYDKEVFSGKVISLISNECVSACDLLAAALKLSQRGFLVGEPTNGGTFGFTQTKMITSNYRDSLDLISMNIPNYIFQVAHIKDERRFMNILDFNKLELIENNPTIPDISLALTENDITNDFTDYKKKILELIQSK